MQAKWQKNEEESEKAVRKGYLNTREKVYVYLKPLGSSLAVFSDHLSLAACESILRPLLAEAEIVADVIPMKTARLTTDLISDSR